PCKTQNKWATRLVAEWPSAFEACRLFFGVASREDRRNVVEDVGGADFVVTEVLDEARLDDVDLLLRVLVDDRGDERLQLDRVLLILEQLQLERAAEAIVRAPDELLSFDRERSDEVHDLAPEVVFAVLGDVDLLFDRPHEALIRILVLTGVPVLDALLQ